MTWFKVDDGLHGHVKAIRAGLEAMGLWVLTGSWVANHEDDGRCPREIVERIAGKRGLALAKRLVSAGLWEEDGPSGWVFHDWSKYNPLADELEEKRDRRAAAGRAGGLQSGVSRRSKREASASEANEAIVEAKRSNASTTDEPPSRPVPSRPEEEEPPLPPKQTKQGLEPPVTETRLRAAGAWRYERVNMQAAWDDGLRSAGIEQPPQIRGVEWTDFETAVGRKAPRDVAKRDDWIRSQSVRFVQFIGSVPAADKKYQRWLLTSDCFVRWCNDGAPSEHANACADDDPYEGWGPWGTAEDRDKPVPVAPTSEQRLAMAASFTKALGELSALKVVCDGRAKR